MRWFLTFMLGVIMAAGVQAATLQARLIRASNEAPSDAKLKDLTPRLKRQFGYQHYRLLGSKQEKLKLKTAKTFDVGNGFSVVATLKTSLKRVHEINIQWMSGKTKVVTTTVKMSEGSHIFIKGPGVGDDWIVLALNVQR